AGGVGMGGSMYRSTDDGDTWVEMINGMTNTNIQAIAMDESDRIYVGTSDGAYVSDNNGDQWNEINVGLTTTDIRALAYLSPGSMLAGTKGGGVFRSELIIGVDELSSNGQLLGMNHPDPCNTITFIPYVISEAGHVTLELFDAQGRLVDQ